MGTITLNNGVEMPTLGLGVFQTPPDETRDAVRSALGAGYRLIDTAAAYGNEREVGEAVHSSELPRSEVFLETKVWISDYGYEETALTKTMWGYGGVVQAPDGTIWKLATSSKKDNGPASREFTEIALLLGVASVSATKKFYTERGLKVAKSFGPKYMEFESAPGAPVKLALYRRAGLAKDAGVAAEGSGSHRLVIGSDTPAFTDPDGFSWEEA